MPATGGWSGCRIAREYPGLDTEQLGLMPSRWSDGAASCSSRSSPARRRSRDDGAVRGGSRALPVRGVARDRAGDASPARPQLEDDRRQLFGRAAYSGRPSRADPAVRRELRDRGARMGRPDGGRAARRRRRPIRRSAPIRRCCPRPSICPPATAASGSITSCSPTSPSTSIPTRSISCSSCRSARPRR